MAIEWTEIKTDEAVPGTGPFAPLWSLAIEAVIDWKFLRFHAEGAWTFLPDSKQPCGPDGAAGLSLDPSALILSDCPPACLLGRFGGSSASLGRVRPGSTADPAAPETESPPVRGIFAIGRDCLYKVPEGVFGPLFIGFNLTWRPVTIKSLQLTIKGANL